MNGYTDTPSAMNVNPNYRLDTLGPQQLKTGGGYICGGINVKTAGSGDSYITLYDGTSTEGLVLAMFGFSQTGFCPTGSMVFKVGLFANITGTAAGVAGIAFN
jgi:hypothetical protein